MKLFGAVILVLAVATSYAEINSSEVSPVFGYHFKEGIRKANEIKKIEEQTGNSPQRIVNGQVTDISEVPYQAGLVIQILFIFTSVCGASILSETRVLTAAHCNHDGSISAQSFTAVLGSNTLFSGGQRIRTIDVVMHPEWNPQTAANDVAILRISGLVLNNLAQPIALPSGNQLSETFAGQTALASGYGLTRDGGSIGTNQVLSSVNLPIITNVECASVYGQWVHDTNICTSGAEGRGTCSGDSGGPLAVDSGAARVLIGVTSYGAEAGCEAGFPAAFARVSEFVSWINSI